MRIGYYNLVDAINKEFRKVGFKTVTYGTYTEFDMDTQTLYPALHIVIPDGNESEVVTQIVFDLIVADLVDIQKEYQPTENEVFDITNTLDVHQDLMAKRQQAIKMIDRNQNGVEIVLPVGWSGFKEQFTNLLAGWTISARFEVENLDSHICD